MRVVYIITHCQENGCVTPNEPFSRGSDSESDGLCIRNASTRPTPYFLNTYNKRRGLFLRPPDRVSSQGIDIPIGARSSKNRNFRGLDSRGIKKLSWAQVLDSVEHSMSPNVSSYATQDGKIILLPQCTTDTALFSMSPLSLLDQLRECNGVEFHGPITRSLVTCTFVAIIVNKRLADSAQKLARIEDAVKRVRIFNHSGFGLKALMFAQWEHSTEWQAAEFLTQLKSQPVISLEPGNATETPTNTFEFNSTTFIVPPCTRRVKRHICNFISRFEGLNREHVNLISRSCIVAAIGHFAIRYSPEVAAVSFVELCNAVSQLPSSASVGLHPDRTPTVVQCQRPSRPYSEREQVEDSRIENRVYKVGS